MIYHLNDIRGMSEWYEKFGIMGLSSDLMQVAVQTAGSFMLKASELQQWVSANYFVLQHAKPIDFVPFLTCSGAEILILFSHTQGH